MTDYGYARVSSREQKEEGKSIEAQIHKLKQAGIQENNIYIDSGITGGVKEDMIETRYKHRYFEIHIDLNIRKGLMNLLEIIKPGDTLTITKYNRISRSVVFQDTILTYCKQRNITVKTIIDTFTDNLTRRIHAVIDENEIDNTRERNETVAEARYQKGQWGYRPPKGYTMQEDGSLTPDRYAPKIKDIFTSLAKGENYKDICQRLNIQKQTLYNTVRNKAYLGMTHFQNQWIQSPLITPLITQEIFDQANSKIKKKKITSPEPEPQA